MIAGIAIDEEPIACDYSRPAQSLLGQDRIQDSILLQVLPVKVASAWDMSLLVLLSRAHIQNNSIVFDQIRPGEDLSYRIIGRLIFNGIRFGLGL